MRPLFVLSFLLAGCGGSTGSGLVTFSGAASGPRDADGGPLSFTTGSGTPITLTKAELHLGAVYLNQSVPLSGAGAEPCVSTGIYAAEVFGPIDVDLLSPSPVKFPTTGEGTETEAKAAEVWLTEGDVNATEDTTVILDVEGTANQAGTSFPFTASITIGSNRTPAITNPAMPSANPICHQRIVAPILVDITPTNRGTLALEVDPRKMFNAVDFTKATQVSDSPPAYEIPDDSAAPGGALFSGLKSSAAYSFTWTKRR